MAYWKELSPRAAVRELARNYLNRRQLKGSRRVRQAWNSAAAVLAASREAARNLRDAFGEAPPVCLETGLAPRAGASRRGRRDGEPLRILWSGRLRPWKGLSLLLKALAALPPDCNYHLRILGEGPAERRWRRVAEKLGVSHRVEWVGWPEYSGQLPHYDWADVFAFTSLRDTSGTGLLEALAAGAPIIGVDHQGAADIMSESCAIRVPVSTPAATIAGFREAVLRLSADDQLLERLSCGALQRATDFHWDKHWEFMRCVYERALGQPASSHSRATVASAPPANAPPSTTIALEAVY
jgi:glycosyltransferase involved in cell wall biosynthesis